VVQFRFAFSKKVENYYRKGMAQSPRNRKILIFSGTAILLLGIATIILGILWSNRESVCLGLAFFIISALQFGAAVSKPK